MDRYPHTRMTAPFHQGVNPIQDAFQIMGSAPDIYNAAEAKTFGGLAHGYAEIARGNLSRAQAAEVANRDRRAQELRAKFPLFFGGGAPNPAPQQQTGGQQQTVASTDETLIGDALASADDSIRRDGMDKFGAHYRGSFYVPKRTFENQDLYLRDVLPQDFKPRNPTFGVTLPDESEMGKGVIPGSNPFTIPGGDKFDFAKALSAIAREKVPQSAIPAQKAPAPTEQFNPADINHFIAVAISGDNPEKLAEMMHKGFITGQQAILIDRINKMPLSDADKVSGKAQILGLEGLDLYDTLGEIRGRSENALGDERFAHGREHDAQAGRHQTQSVEDLAGAQKKADEAERVRKLLQPEIDTEKARAENLRATAGKNEAQGGYYDSKAGSLGKGGMSDEKYAKLVEDEVKALRKGNLLRKGGPVPDDQLIAEARRNVDQVIANRGGIRLQGSPVVSGTEPPAGAVELLKKNPSMSIAFDAKYGAGMARKYLEGR